jgi:hypothetical protein
VTVSRLRRLCEPAIRRRCFRERHEPADCAARQQLANTVFETRAKCINFTLEHMPALSRMLYYDWRLETQVATESRQ